MSSSRIIPLVICALLAMMMPAQAVELAVVVGRDSPVKALTPKQISDLYLGRTRAVDMGAQLKMLELARDSELRKTFFQRLNGMPIRQVNAYWARLQFTGEVQPPVALPDSRAVLAMLRKDPHSIGYVEMAAVDGSVRTLLELND